VQQTIVVGAAGSLSQKVTFAAISNKTLLQSPLTLTATASSGLPVSFATTTPLACTTSGTDGTTITLLGTGTCTVVASQGGDATYAAATPASRSFGVSA
jgi:hypothetical protein